MTYKRDDERRLFMRSQGFVVCAIVLDRQTRAVTFVQYRYEGIWPKGDSSTEKANKESMVDQKTG
jgi:hypothetical protein